MKKVLIACVALAFSVLSLAFDEPGTPAARWPVKTSLPTSASLRKHAHPDLNKLIHLDPPPAYVRKQTRSVRIPGKVSGLADGQMVQVDGYVHMLARDPDGDYHLQITESADKITPCFIIELPKPEAAFVADAALRSSLETARAKIRLGLLHDENKEPSSGGHVMAMVPKMRIIGQLFYDDQHTGAGRKGKLGCKELPSWEIHPVTKLSFLEPKKGNNR